MNELIEAIAITILLIITFIIGIWLGNIRGENIGKWKEMEKQIEKEAKVK